MISIEESDVKAQESPELYLYSQEPGLLYSRTSGCDQPSLATSFPKYQTFASQITIFGNSCK